MQLKNFTFSKKIPVAILTCFITTMVYGNEYFIVNRTINWSADPYFIFTDNPNNKTESLIFDGAQFEKSGTVFLPAFSENFLITAKGTVSFQFTDEQYEPITEKDFLRNAKIGNQIDVKSEFVIQRKKNYIQIYFIPIRKNPNTGQYEKLVSFNLKVNIESNISTARLVEEEEHTYSAHSVLASGNWYKFSVNQDGIFKIDKNFLQALGIDVASLNTLTFSVYGGTGGMLPELNSAPNYDDLTELAIYRSGGLSDGSFDNDDYVLFYGQSPNQWKFDALTKNYSHSTHLYSSNTYYFIRTDGGTYKTISSQSNSLLTPTYITSSFDKLFVWDIDKVNLINSGRQWFDTPLDNFSGAREYSTTLPDLITNDAANKVKIKMILAAKSSAGPSAINFTGSFPATANFNSVVENTEGPYADTSILSYQSTPTSSDINISAIFSGPANAQGWIDYIELQGRSNLKYNAGSQLFFSDGKGVVSAGITRYNLNAPDYITIWDVTDPFNVKTQAYSGAGSADSFALPSDTLKKFAVFNLDADPILLTAANAVGKIANQDLHNISLNPKLVIISAPEFMSEARKLAAWHYDVNNYDTIVADVNQIYNEFSSGTPDITAIRNFIRMFYDRAGTDESLMPKYVLLFGDASFDYKNIVFSAEENTNRVLTFQSYESINQVETFPTDDYYGCLDAGEGANMNSSINVLDVGIGRLPVNSLDEASAAVNKILHYKASESLGNWRNTVCFVADDEDNDTHIKDADKIANWIRDSVPLYNISKLYLDAYQQVPGAGGERYPAVEAALNNQIFTGTLIMNWTGHGNEQNWAQERILSVDDINGWTNYDKLPLFITATCSFSRFDNPERTSAGELIFLNSGGGGIALVSTVRIVYSFANYTMNSNFIYKAFKPLNGVMPALGDAVMLSKNASLGAGTVNCRKFLLLGDPALTLNYAKYNVVTDSVNGVSIATADTLKALQKVTIKGEIKNSSGEKLTTFNGTVYPTIYDKPINITTLVNDPINSYPYTFSLQKNAIYKGKASVINGGFQFSFIVPKDISYSYGNGKLSYYADDNTEDAAGYETNVIIGGAADSVATDNTGPQLDVYMNDEKFVFGGLTDENPFLFVKLNDFNGINTVGNGIGHDIISTLDDAAQGENLNDYYEADLDSYQSGTLKYPLTNIAPGRHSITVKAWDVYNNSGEGYTEFVVAESAKLALDHILNYPNPFTTRTSFWFEHNRPGDVLDVKVEIYTVSGKLIKTIQQQIISESYRVSDIEWDGLDNYGDAIGKGVYVYRLSVKAESDNSKASEFQKLVILK